MKWWRICISLLIAETIGLLIQTLLTGSQPEEQIFFNLSMIRLVSAAGIIMILGLSFLLLQSFRKKDLFKAFIYDDRRMFTLMLAGFLAFAVDLFLLCAEKEFTRDWQALYLNLKPMLAWGFLAALQVSFFSTAWFSHLYAGSREAKPGEKNSDELVIVFGIFVILVIVKILFVIQTAYGPVIQGDELRYFNMAKYLYQGEFYIENINHSPYFYSAMIAVSFLFGDMAYTAMKWLNILYSSSILFPLFIIARKYFSLKTSILVTLSACLLPFHLLFPRMLMSENLYFPLLLWAILFILNEPRNARLHWIWHFCAGISIGLLYLTRYISLAIIPAFLGAWWYIRMHPVNPTTFPSGTRKPHQIHLYHFTLLLFGIVVGFSAWIASGMKAGVPAHLLLGFGITAETTSAQLTIQNLFIWAGFYLCCLVLMASPFLPFFFIPVKFHFRDWEPEIRHWFILIFALLAGFLAAAARHSWRALYNSKIPDHIMGRYILYFTPLLIISALLLIRQQKSLKHTKFGSQIMWMGILPSGLIAMSYAILFGNLFHLHDGNLIKVLGSVDGAYIQYLGIYFFLVLLILYAANIWLIWKEKMKLLLRINVCIFFLYYSIGLAPYYQDLMANQDFQFLADRLIQMHRHGTKRMSDTIRILTPADTSDRDRALMLNTITMNNNDDFNVISIENLSIGLPDENKAIQDVVILKYNDPQSSQFTEGEIVEFDGQKYILIFPEKY